MRTVCSWDTGLSSAVSPHQFIKGSAPHGHGSVVLSASENKKSLVIKPSIKSWDRQRISHSHDSVSSKECSTSTNCVLLDALKSKRYKNDWSKSRKAVVRAVHDDFTGKEVIAGNSHEPSISALAKFSPDKSRRQRCLGQQTVLATSAVTSTREKYVDEADFMKAGGEFIDLVQLQARKSLEQSKIGQKLAPISEKILDLIVIGCGPAGLSLAAEAAKQGLTVGLIGPDLPFTNNYGVWKDEFAALGLENCIAQIWKDSAMYFESDTPLLIGRAYGRVDRHGLHEELLKRCAEGGVQYLDSEAERVSDANNFGSTVTCTDGSIVSSRLVAVASGAAAGKFLKYEPGGPGVTVQTAYGMEVEVENFSDDPEVMVFMDYRDYKAWGTENCPDAEEFKEVPSFLYAMPVSSCRVFFEETCLAARPTMPFTLLKERLLIRLEKMGIKVLHTYEEEWSYIPVGATLPDTTQQHLGFGAAASMVHPATGYSVVRSLSEAPAYAAAIAMALRSGERDVSANPQWKHPRAAALEAWNALWPKERKRQRAFFQFGLELILQLDLPGIREFFDTFFKLPDWLWKGFLAANLTSLDLVWFAFLTFVVAPNALRYRLVSHLMSDPSGTYLVRTYVGLKGTSEPTPSSPQLPKNVTS